MKMYRDHKICENKPHAIPQELHMESRKSHVKCTKHIGEAYTETFIFHAFSFFYLFSSGQRWETANIRGFGLGEGLTTALYIMLGSDLQLGCLTLFDFKKKKKNVYWYHDIYLGMENHIQWIKLIFIVLDCMVMESVIIKL